MSLIFGNKQFLRTASGVGSQFKALQYPNMALIIAIFKVLIFMIGFAECNVQNFYVRPIFMSASILGTQDNCCFLQNSCLHRCIVNVNSKQQSERWRLQNLYNLTDLELISQLYNKDLETYSFTDYDGIDIEKFFERYSSWIGCSQGEKIYFKIMYQFFFLRLYLISADWMEWNVPCLN